MTSPVAAGPVDDNTALGVAVRLEALADPARVKLMSLLLAPETGEATTGGLADLVGLSESTVSHHPVANGLLSGTRHRREPIRGLGGCRLHPPER